MAKVCDAKESLPAVGSCAFCLNYFTDPVTIDCGHNFCRSCITFYWQKLDTNFPCPQCKETSTERNLRPNRQLANVIEIAKSLQLSKRLQEDNLCEEHGKKVKLFCAEDWRLLCVGCDRSQDHKSHHVTPMEEAAEEYKEKFESHLTSLRKELDDIFKYKCSEQKKAKELKLETVIKKQKIILEFEELHQFLNEEQRVLLSMLEQEEEEILQRFRERMTQLEEQSLSLNQLILEIEKKCQHSDIELLKDVKDSLNRYQEREIPKPEATSTEGKMCLQLSYPRQTIILRKLMKKLGETHYTELEWWTKYTRYAVDVTLDPETAHPQIILSNDRKSVQHRDTAMKMPDIPEGFDASISVLGCHGITTGRHYWEVKVGDATDWAFGVCKDSVSRNEKIALSPGNGYWALGLWKGKEYLAFTSCKIFLLVKPKIIGIFVDYEAGKVSFYNVDEKSHLFTFTDNFVGTLRPYFSPGVNTGSQNTGALKIQPVLDWE
ncbi:E3 ubiquitin-protein ligase TRIM39 [Microcaecilia unicolor]|uniref:E3 ubiquitin-protein ligase TRIM39-like n=1 Tax=Microcaecilia unicolor TaxID=1415580 RepID=A0A6P7XRV4_9AMPH|nr:E3 ubiquitin-protein ligase TRIM39-like [Microcaecilia unicolor]